MPSSPQAKRAPASTPTPKAAPKASTGGGASPFVTKSIRCPACKEKHEQRFFRQRMFVAAEKEADQHVVTYKWLSDNVEPVHPPFYFLFFCPNCYYTDTTEEYANPTSSDHVGRTVKAFKKLGEKERNLLEYLAGCVNYEAIDFESALNLHFLGILTQMFVPKDDRDHYKIGRLMLRTGWLYREFSPDSGGTRKVPAVEEILSELLPLEGTVNRAQDEWNAVTRAVERRVVELTGEVPAEKNPYTKMVEGLEETFSRLFGQLHEAKMLCKRDTMGRLLDENAGSEAKAYGDCASHEEYIAKLKGACPFLPSDEPEALRSCVRYFEHAISVDPRFDSPQAHYAVVSLMADIFVRLNDFDSAFGMVRSMYKAATDSRVKAQRELNQNKEMEPMTRRRHENTIKRSNFSLAQAAELRHKLMDQLIERDLPAIQKMLNENAGASPEAIARKLEEMGIMPSIIERLQDKGVVPAVASKKKRK